MLTVRLNPEIEAQLDELAHATGRSKSHYVRQAIQEFLEDRADYLIAIAALDRNEPTMSAEQLRRELGL